MLDGATVDNDGTATLNVTDVAGTTLSFAATDNVGVTYAEVKIGTATHELTIEEGVYSYTFEALAAGDYEIVITVKDAAGNEDTFSFTLVVTEQEPV